MWLTFFLNNWLYNVVDMVLDILSYSFAIVNDMALLGRMGLT